MKVIYYPKVTPAPEFAPIPGQNVAFAVLLPDSYVTDNKYGWMLMVHGIGERSAGTKENLENLVLGQKQPDGTRKWPFVKDFHKEAVDKYGLVIVVPTYEDKSTFDVSKVNWTRDFIIKKYSVVYEMLFAGFSLGGGSVVGFSTSSVENANKVAVAVPCAPTNDVINASVVGEANLPMHFFGATKDWNKNTDLAVTKSIIGKVNFNNPGIKAQYTAFDSTDHLGFDQGTTITPPVAPGGQGITNLNENVYDWYFDVLKNGPRQMKSGNVQPVPPEPNPTPVTLKAEFNILDGQVVTTSILEMDASASTGVKSGIDDWNAYVWDIKVVNASSNKSYDVRPEGGPYDSDPKKRLIDIVDGRYSITLTVRDRVGNKATKTVEIIANLSNTKVVKAFDSQSDLVSFTNGTSESARATLMDGRWSIRSASGQTYDL